MKPFKRHNKRLLIMIAMSISCACTSSVYAEITTRPELNHVYDEFVNYDGDDHKKSFAGLCHDTEGSYTLQFNQGATLDNSNAGISDKSIMVVKPTTKLTITTGENKDLTIKGYTNYGDIYAASEGELYFKGGNIIVESGTRDSSGSSDVAAFDINNAAILNIDAESLCIKNNRDDVYNRTAFNILNDDERLATKDLNVDIKLKKDFIIKDASSGILMQEETSHNTNTIISADNISITTNNNNNNASTGYHGAGLYALAYKNTGKANLNLTANKNLSVISTGYALYTYGSVTSTLNAQNIDLTSSKSYAIYSSKNSINTLTANTLNISGKGFSITAYSDSTVNAQAEKAINIKGTIWTSGGNITVGKDSSILQTVINGDLTAKNNGYITAFVNNAGSSFTGNTTDAHWQDVNTRDAGNKGIHLTLNDGSVWNDFDYDSTIQVLDTSKAKVDMQDSHFKGLFIGTLKGDKSTFNMDIDAGTNTNNSDRLYIAGTHTGNHYITLNNVNADGNTDGAAGTVLVSVKDEQGNFFANDKEGSLYWNKYTLDKQDSATPGYTKDWYLKKVEFIPSKPTTSVDAVDATQRLAFANWVEDDKLMQRMGDLRHETNNEEGVWVRVKGGKYSGDGFSNRHTMYQLGYDDVVKENDKLKRYQGVAFSYDDGKNSFNRGSGKLKAKSIGFYSTDIRNKGHYLDLAFKIYDADSDFTVFDSEGKKITGAFDNTGISLSAEYGRKKYLDEHWSIEPQAQLTLGYLGGARYTTSNGIHVSQSDPNSVLGRIGCNFMYDMDENNTVYLKANWLHQFAGNYGATLTNGNDSLRIDNHDHDTWFEYGFGFACMTGKNNHLYADVERSTGGSLRKNWQWNAGMFWTF
ncbi:autotransporter outer membrane beta-barrel domain-containing protein [Dialister sp. i34-0019-2H8]|uniref:autotransporter family protein n=1 Tax=Dialister sp. i34-0019-2H8 TaxID=3141190 RepID=UPI0034ABC9DD